MQNNLTILIVDDEASIRKFVIKALQRQYGIVPLEAEDKHSALAALAHYEHGPLLVVTDCQMRHDGEKDNENGLKLCEALRADPRTTSASIILCSGTANGTQALNAGADRFMQKPFALLNFLGAIQSALDQRYGPEAPKPATALAIPTAPSPAIA